MQDRKEPSIRFAVPPNPDVPFEIVHADDDLLVVNKPAGVVTQPGKGHAADSLLNGLFDRYGKLLQNLGVKRDWGLLHRLDKQTSGLLLVALRPNAYDALRAQFEQRQVCKEYLALVRGRPSPPQGVVQARLKEISTVHVKKVIVSRSGRDAISSYRVLSGNARASLVAVAIKTGRLHQIRAHMMFLGTPVLGDDLYDATDAQPGKVGRRRSAPGNRIPTSSAGRRAAIGVPRLCLHCWKLGFKHPGLAQWREFHLPPPPDMIAVAQRLGCTIAI